jgi:hypothetical protein
MKLCIKEIEGSGSYIGYRSTHERLRNCHGVEARALGIAYDEEDTYARGRIIYGI